MTDIYKAPYLTYGAIAPNVVSAAANTAIVANLNVLKAALTPSKPGVALPSPGFNNIPPEMAALIVGEINAQIALVQAAPTS